MKKVLLPIDGSDCSLRGLELVISKRANYEDPQSLDIHLVNVQMPLSQDITRFASRDQIADFHRDESEKQLHDACELLDASGIKYTCHCEVGLVAETITALADQLQCDEIVMGTHGHGAFQGLVTGSITLKVLRLSKIPVLLIK